MINSILGIIHGTPWLVWIVLVYLIFMGIKSLNPSVKQIYTLFIIPMLFFGISLQGLCKSLQVANVAIWFVGLSIGIAFGWFLFRKVKIKADKVNSRIFLPGTKMTLFFVISIFIVKYFFGYQMAIHPAIIQRFSFNIARIGIFALITGLSMGRMAILLYKYQKAPHTDFHSSMF